MLRLLGIGLLSAGCMGIGWTWKERLRKGLEESYEVWQILKMFQSEIIYSRAPLPEACLRIAGRVPEPYGEAFLEIHKEMLVNRGTTFGEVWRRQMEGCAGKLVMPVEEKKRLLGFGSCVGFMDGQVQAQMLEQHIRRLELSIERQEKEMVNKSRVIMSLSVMGGFMLAVILI